MGPESVPIAIPRGRRRRVDRPEIFNGKGLRRQHRARHCLAAIRLGGERRAFDGARRFVPRQRPAAREIACIAIAARTGLTSITHYRQLERREGEPISASLVRRGTAERFAPVVMTAVVAALAFLPFALLGNIAGHEILHPMAGVVLGGLVTTTLVNLLVIPSLYLRFGADAEPEIIIEEKPWELIA